MKVIKKINLNETSYALNFWNCTAHMHDRMERIARTGLGLGRACAGFLVDKGHENGLEEHFITNTGLIVIRNHVTRKAITVIIARPVHIERYYKALGHSVPSKFLEVAYYNTKVRKLNY